MANTLRERGALYFNVVGCYCAVGAKCLRWRPEEKAQADWVLHNAGDVLRPTYTNLMDPRQSLARQRILSCDLHKLDEFRNMLQRGDRRVFTINAKDDSTRDDTSRCMAVALAATSAFIEQLRRASSSSYT